MHWNYMHWGKLIYDKIYDWLQIAVKMPPNFAVAVIVLVYPLNNDDVDTYAQTLHEIIKDVMTVLKENKMI